MEKMHETYSPNRSFAMEFLRQEKSFSHLVKSAGNYAYQLLPKHLENNPGISDNPHLSKVILQGDYQGVDPTSEEYSLLRSAKSIFHKLTRKCLKEAIEDPESRVQLTPVQKIALRYGLQIQDVTDDIDITWYDELVRGKDAEDIKKKMEDKEFADKVVGEHGEFIYGLVRKTPEGDYEYLTYAKAYPQQIEKIAGLIDGMINELDPLAKEGSKEAKALIDTQTELKTLLTLDGTVQDGIAKKQEIQAKKLATTWVVEADQKKMSVDILHPMEAYTAGNFVEWQYDILIKVPEFEEMNQHADETKEWMLHLLRTDKDFKRSKLMQESLAILEPTQAVVYVRLPSGTSERFRSAASNVPNEPEVRLAHNRNDSKLANGSKINFDYQTFLERGQISKPLYEKLFGKDRSNEIFGDTSELIPLLLSRFVAGHEDAHNILEHPKTMEILGIQMHMDMDEAKADLASLYACFATGFLNLRDKQNLAKALFAEELRGLSRWNDRNIDRTHLNGNLLLIQLMMDTGILTYSKNSGSGEVIWDFDIPSEEKLTALSKGAKNRLLELSKTYEAKNRKRAHKKGKDFQRKYFDYPSESMLRLLKDSGIIKEDEYTNLLLNQKHVEKSRFWGLRLLRKLRSQNADQ